MDNYNFILQEEAFLDGNTKGSSMLAKQTYLTGGTVNNAWLNRQTIKEHTKYGYLNILGNSSEEQFIFSNIFSIGQLNDDLKEVIISIHFYLTDSYPCVIIRLGLDDGTKNNNSDPDLLYLEHRVYIHNITYRIFLYEILKARDLILIYYDNDIQKEIKINFRYKNAFLNEVKCIFEYIKNKQYDSNIPEKANKSFMYIEGLMTSAGIPKMSGTTMVLFNNLLINRLNQNIKPDVDMWNLITIKNIFVQINSVIPLYTSTVEKINQIIANTDSWYSKEIDLIEENEQKQKAKEYNEIKKHEKKIVLGIIATIIAIILLIIFLMK